jgi:mannose-1-phosphate guanylyltransferase / mannose-6-phosphate isomerase
VVSCYIVLRPMGCPPMADLITPLIMCGGAGARLWPASRETRPKQFLPLMGARSTFQETLLRVSDPELFGRPVLITNSSYRFLVTEQMAAIGVEGDVLLEPARRDSGPAICAGAEYARRRDGEPLMIALAADHFVIDTEAFIEACRVARRAALEDRIVTFGVRPTRAATEYGYIRPGADQDRGVFKVEAFVEKPCESVARTYVAEGYLWNSGNFMFRTGILLNEYRRFEPDSVDAIRAAVECAGSDLGFVTLGEKHFAKAAAKSIDYAVMEKTNRSSVVPVSYGWSDVGSWNSVWELSERDPAGNASRGSTLLVDTRDSFVASDKALVALFGVQDLVVIASEDAILVTHRDRASDLKKLVDRLKTTAPAVIESHLTVHRPWGYYHSLDLGERYQVKRIVVKPGKRLSLQSHNHRAEHWVVVRGTARVTIDDEVKMIHENESTYIPIGAKHRLQNVGKIDLDLIEVQTGSYLGEDDIERFDDDFHRS